MMADGVTSLELSRELRDLGLKQEVSEKVWARFGDKWILCIKTSSPEIFLHNGNTLFGEELKDAVDARSLDEWLEILPKTIGTSTYRRAITTYHLGYMNEDCTWLYNTMFKLDKNPSEAAGLLWIWLAENGYLKKEEK